MERKKETRFKAILIFISIWNKIDTNVSEENEMDIFSSFIKSKVKYFSKYFYFKKKNASEVHLFYYIWFYSTLIFLYIYEFDIFLKNWKKSLICRIWNVEVGFYKVCKNYLVLIVINKWNEMFN